MLQLMFCALDRVELSIYRLRLRWRRWRDKRPGAIRYMKGDYDSGWVDTPLEHDLIIDMTVEPPLVTWYGRPEKGRYPHYP